MRRSGLVDTAEGLGTHDHVCWAFDEPAEFRFRAAQFLVDGLSSGQRVYCIAGGDPSRMVNDLMAWEGFAAALGSGMARVLSVRAIYPAGSVVDPTHQVAVYAGETDAALAEGFAGLRVAADVTSLVGTPEQLDAFARYEQAADRYLTRHPFTALCGFNRTAVGAGRLAELACLHPVVSGVVPPFRFHASSDPAVSVVLAGEVDLAGHQLFAAALRRADPAPIDGAVVVDAREVSFMDHRGVSDLASEFGRPGRPVVLWVRPNSVLSILAGVLDLPGLRVRPARPGA